MDFPVPYFKHDGEILFLASFVIYTLIYESKACGCMVVLV